MSTTNIVITVISIAVVAFMGGFVGLVTARITATLMARGWQRVGKAEKAIFIDVATILCTLFGAVCGGVAGYIGLAFGLLYLLAETAAIGAGSVAIWVLVVAALRGIKAGLALSDRGVKYLESRLAG